jgi:hypothetical protein
LIILLLLVVALAEIMQEAAEGPVVLLRHQALPLLLAIH